MCVSAMPRANRVLRRWRVCVNGEPEDVVGVSNRLKDIDRERFGIRFCVWQIERAPTTGRLHVQAYFEFTRGVKCTHVYVVCGQHVDCRSCDASTQANIDYVTKEDTREEGPF